MSLSFCNTVTASADENIKVIIDIKNVKFDVPPTIVNGRTLVPLRAIFEALGATVEWDDATQTVTSEKGTYDYSVYGNTDEEYLAMISCAYFIRTLPVISSTTIHSVNAGYYDGAFLTILNLTSNNTKTVKANVVLRLETNSTVTPLRGG